MFMTPLAAGPFRSHFSELFCWWPTGDQSLSGTASPLTSGASGTDWFSVFSPPAASDRLC